VCCSPEAAAAPLAPTVTEPAITETSAVMDDLSGITVEFTNNEHLLGGPEWLVSTDSFAVSKAGDVSPQVSCNFC
jgi:Cft2 family RNA processing exonuclease